MLRSKSRSTIFTIAFTVLTGIASQAATLPPEKIDAAIAKAKQYIYSQQKPDGRWEKEPSRKGTDHAALQEQGDTWGGYTALCSYALLASGENPSDPRISSAVEFLKHADIVGIYAVAMRCQVWLLIPHSNPQIKAAILKDADYLFRGINDGKLNPNNRGMWDYLGKGPRVDHSVSQYGILGLWACQQTGYVNVGDERWKLFEAAWKSQQEQDGGWAYEYHNGEEMSMTAAGVATLFIIDDYLHANEAGNCTGNGLDPAIAHGLEYIDKNYGQIGENTYAMYGIERIGTASGYKYFAGHDWYDDIAAHLIKTQQENGCWSSGSYPSAQPIDETAFALLFLARGRAPVLMNKLDYRQPGQGDANWDERPRDMANLTAWVGHQMEVFMNFQIVSLAATAEDLHDAPILYISGSQALHLTPQDAQKIKNFCEQGGMVLANADCNHEAFSNSIKELGKSLFNRDFRELPPDHPAYTHEQYAYSRWRKKPKVLGLSNGVRELMVLIPDADPDRWWQNPSGAAGHEDAFELGADLFQYAVDRKMWPKGVTFIAAPKPTVIADRKVKVARLAEGSNWDPEPGGWVRMAGLLHNDDRVDLSTFKAVPGEGGVAAAQVAHLTGTTDFKLSDDARLELQTFVNHGGTLVVDAAGGSRAFADAALRELAKTVPTAGDALRAPLPTSHAIYHMPGHAITTFSYRSWAHKILPGALKDPHVRGVDIGGRTSVFYSAEDLSAGMVGEPVDGILGYTPETATDIMRNILLYATVKPAGAR